MLQTLRENGLKRGAWNEGEDHVALVRVHATHEPARSRRWRQATRRGRGAVAHSADLPARPPAERLPLLTNDMRLFSRTLFYQGLAQLATGLRRDASILAELLVRVWGRRELPKPLDIASLRRPQTICGPGSLGLRANFSTSWQGFRKREPVHQAFSFHGE